MAYNDDDTCINMHKQTVPLHFPLTNESYPVYNYQARGSGGTVDTHA